MRGGEGKEETGRDTKGGWRGEIWEGGGDVWGVGTRPLKV